jgi:hypothetical protein
VQADTSAFEQFLTSDHGGAWNEDEVHVLWQPKRSDLKDLLRSLDVDYAITVFAGHGWHEEGQGAAILVHPGEGLWVSNFRTSARRQLTVIDACREVQRLLKEGREDRGPKFGVEGLPPDLRYRNACRTAYEREVMSVGEKRSVMWGCNLNQQAGEYPRETIPQGGYFTYNLLDLAAKWGRSRQAARLYQPFPSEKLSVRDAFGMANLLVRDRHFPQEPVLEDGRGEASFPFVVA